MICKGAIGKLLGLFSSRGYTMFKAERSNSTLGSSYAIIELIYHSTVRSIRKSSGNAVLGLLTNIFQTVLLVATFFAMSHLLGMGGGGVRGDFLLYIMSGVFLFMTHTSALGAVMKAEGPTSAMMKHAPMSTAVSISSSALGALYIQILSVVVVLYVYHVAFKPIEIEDPIGALGMLLLAWFTGVAIGSVFMAFKPWAPGPIGIAAQIFARINMIASGKMFLANNLPHKMLVMFDWNPLFHTIDQERGFLFINYNPHFSSISYPLYVGIVLLVIGMMGEFYTRQYASVSWGARG